MILRKNFLPRTLKDIVLTVAVVVFIPVVYWFELFVVLPTYYRLWSFWYNVHLLCSNFVMHNVVGNYIGVIICDTSIKGHVMPSSMKAGWRFCVVCETIAPPRSWHCNTCKTCILKRDHHCLFSGCCIGHTNTRYFLCFLLYAFISCTYATYFNIFYIYTYIDFNNYFSWLSFIFPLASFIAATSMQQFYILLFLLIIICSVFTGVLFIYHITLVLSGQITHERNVNFDGYDYGRRKNSYFVLGEKMYLCFLSPLVRSEQSHDGIHWEVCDTHKIK